MELCLVEVASAVYSDVQTVVRSYKVGPSIIAHNFKFMSYSVVGIIQSSLMKSGVG